jgi:hypothetical protein
MLNLENLLEFIVTDVLINGVYNYFFIRTLIYFPQHEFSYYKKEMKNHI